MNRDRPDPAPASPVNVPAPRQTVLPHGEGSSVQPSRIESFPAGLVRPSAAVHWVIAGLLAVLVTVLILRDGGGTSPAWAQTGMLGARGLFAFTGQIGPEKYGLWMLDVDAGTVWCYEYSPITRRMKLLAGRTFRYDRYLENFNQDDGSTPNIIEELLNQQRQSQMRHRNLANNLGASTQPGLTGS